MMYNQFQLKKLQSEYEWIMNSLIDLRNMPIKTLNHIKYNEIY